VLAYVTLQSPPRKLGAGCWEENVRMSPRTLCDRLSSLVWLRCLQTVGAVKSQTQLHRLVAVVKLITGRESRRTKPTN
jgi:hypothetical protein